ncbi:MAG: hypothetical protein HKN24_06650 [Acidimicrobiales bacterium]|nr:hypothetical protein [Acidimicrobiales bacterium]
MTRQLTQAEVDFVGLSFTDLTGRLFRWEGQLYRAIPAQVAPFYARLFDDGVIDDLVNEQLFVESEISDLEIEGFSLVVWHRTVGPLLYPHEWSDRMLADVAQKQLAFTKRLLEHDLTCGDAHPLNMIFEGSEPIFVDLGSIVRHNEHRSGSIWHKEDQFRAFFLNPLRLMVGGNFRIARWLLREHPNDAELTARSPLLRPTTTSRVKAKLARLLRRRDDSVESSLDALAEEVVSLRPDAAEPAVPPSLDEWIVREIEQMAPCSVLGVSNGDRRTAAAVTLAAERGARSVVVANINAEVNKWYAYASSRKLLLTPGYLDLMSPSDDLSNYWYQPASQRLGSELVVAFGMIDQWVLEDHVRLEVVVDRLATLAKRWLLTSLDTTPAGEIPTWSSDRLPMFENFSLETVQGVLGATFATVTTHEIDDGSGSVWILCERGTGDPHAAT